MANGSNKGLLIGGGVVIAAIAIVGFVLPAEFGMDPTGIGKATGVLKMSEQADGAEGNIYLERGQARQGVLFPLEQPVAAADLPARLAQVLQANGKTVPAADAVKTDRYTYELLPYEGIEMKYELTEGSPIAFSWSAPAPLDFDMHGHPYEGGEELTESYAIEKAASQAAVYVAPFTGIHGWYWQNRTLEPVTVTLDATGAIAKSFTFGPSGQKDRELTPPQAGATAEAGPAAAADPAPAQ